jgi:ribosomal RNA assembly protein
MQETYCESIRKLMQNKERLERELDIKLSNRGKIVFVDSSPDKEFLALQVIDALTMGFSIEQAIELKKDGIILHKINIKHITRRTDLDRIRGRVIGADGKTLKILRDLTSCEIALHDSWIGIIGQTEEIEDAIQAVTSIIQGSKQSNIYTMLEKRRKFKSMSELKTQNALKNLNKRETDRDTD